LLAQKIFGADTFANLSNLQYRQKLVALQDHLLKTLPVKSEIEQLEDAEEAAFRYDAYGLHREVLGAVNGALLSRILSDMSEDLLLGRGAFLFDENKDGLDAKNKPLETLWSEEKGLYAAKTRQGSVPLFEYLLDVWYKNQHLSDPQVEDVVRQSVDEVNQAFVDVALDGGSALLRRIMLLGLANGTRAIHDSLIDKILSYDHEEITANLPLPFKNALNALYN
jgi:hypothetical protein